MTDLAPHPANGNTEPNVCACGCGRIVPVGTRFARGHWAKTPEAREKNREAARARARNERRALVALNADSPPSEQAIPEEVSERLYSADDVVTMLRLIEIPDAKIEKFIDLTGLLETLR